MIRSLNFKRTFSIVSAVFLASISLLCTQTASATPFYGNNLMDDAIFNNSASMTGPQIDSWLNNNFPGSCISTANGFAAPDPSGYSPSGGYTYGGDVSAGTIIHDASVAYGINPQVLLATLQKEQSLITGTGAGGCNTRAYSAAVGYGCPDSGTEYNYSGVDLYTMWGTPVTSISGTCVDSSKAVGFSQQIIHAAWLLKFGEERSEGNTSWAVITGNWDNTDDLSSCYYGPMTQGNFKRCPTDTNTTYFDGYDTIDGVSTHLDTGSTAALYWYTPHFSGNTNFDNIFTNWFGSYYAGYSWSTSGYKVLTADGNSYVDPGNLQPGQHYLIDMAATNTGNATWSNSGFNPVNLGTGNPDGHTSGFCTNGWISCTRPTSVRQSSVPPGGVGNFDFLIQAPYTPGSYRDSFTPLAENLRWMQDSSQSLGIVVQNPGTYSWYTTGYKVLDQAGDTYVDPGQLQANQTYLVDMAATNTGTATWYNSGPTPVRLSTDLGFSHNSQLCTNGWIACSRPTTLRESSVPPGGVGHFDFLIQAPPTPGPFTENFKPIAEMYTSMNGSANENLGIIVH